MFWDRSQQLGSNSWLNESDQSCKLYFCLCWGLSPSQTYSSWFEWRLHLLVLQLLPVHVAEEAVLPDVPLPLRTAAQALRWMLRHQLGG